MNTRQELLSYLPNLPPPTETRLATDVWMGFRARWHGPVLARVRLGPGGHQIHEPPPHTDLRYRHMDRQLLFTFSEHHMTRDTHMVRALNTQLGGGRQYPVWEGIVGMFGNLAYSVVSTGISAARQRASRDVRVRQDDQIWVIEMVGKQAVGTTVQLKHVVYLWLVDVPRGGTAGRGGSNAWMLMERRYDLVAPEGRTRAPGTGDLVPGTVSTGYDPLRH